MLLRNKILWMVKMKKRKISFTSVATKGYDARGQEIISTNRPTYAQGNRFADSLSPRRAFLRVRKVFSLQSDALRSRVTRERKGVGISSCYTPVPDFIHLLPSTSLCSPSGDFVSSTIPPPPPLSPPPPCHLVLLK